MSGTILRTRKREIDRKLDELAFEVNRFLDTPVKRWQRDECP